MQVESIRKRTLVLGDCAASAWAGFSLIMRIKACIAASWRRGASRLLLAALLLTAFNLAFGSLASAQIPNEWTWMSGQTTIPAVEPCSGPSGQPRPFSATANWTDSSGHFWLLGLDPSPPCGVSGFVFRNGLGISEFNPSTGVWVGFGSGSSSTGLDGQLGVPAAGNFPGPRGVSSSWTDASGNFWLFGGQGYNGSGQYGWLNDLWEFNPTTKLWAWMGGGGTFYGNAEGLRGVYGESGIPAAANTPGSRTGATSWTDSNGKLWLLGGWGYDSNASFGALNDLWMFNPSTIQWTWMGGSNTVVSSSNAPGAAGLATSGQPGVYGAVGTPSVGSYPGGRQSASSWTDGSGNLWLFGGLGYDSNGTGGYLNDLWEFSPATNQWIWISGSKLVPSAGSGQRGVYGTLLTPAAGNISGGRYSATNWIDAKGNLWLLGGLGIDGNGVEGNLNDLWRFSVSTGQWTWMSGRSAVPSTGAGQPGVYGILGTPSAATTPGGRSAGSGWTDSSGRLWLFGGWGDDSVGNVYYLIDFWEYQPPAADVVIITPPGGAQAPSVTTGPASALTNNSATLAGTVIPNGADTQAWILYGTSSTLSGASQTAVQDLGWGLTASPLGAGLSGLTAATTYFFQGVAQNSAGTTYGSINSFTTAAAASSVHVSAYLTPVAPGDSAQSVEPAGIAVDHYGNLYMTDDVHNQVLMDRPSGTGYSQTVLPFTGLNGAQGVAVDLNGNVYVADTGNTRVLKLTLAGGVYAQSTLVQLPSTSSPLGVAVDDFGNVYYSARNFAQGGVDFVAKETLSGGIYTPSVITSLTGGSLEGPIAVDSLGNVYVTGYLGGYGVMLIAPGPNGYALSPYSISSHSAYYAGLAVDGSNNLYYSYWQPGGGYPSVIEISQGAGTVVASTGISLPESIAVDSNGNLYICGAGDPAGHNSPVVKQSLLGGVIPPTNVQGSPDFTVGAIFTFDTGGTLGSIATLTHGALNGQFAASSGGTGPLCTPGATYNAGDTCVVWVLDLPLYPGPLYGAVELLDTSSNVLATAYVGGFGIGPQVSFLPGTQSMIGSGFATPTSVALDGSGNLYVADTGNNQVVKETLTSNGYSFNTIGSGFGHPNGVAVDGSGSVYIADTDNGQIVKETPLASGYNQTTVAKGLYGPKGIAVDGSGNVYIPDSYNNQVLKETLTPSGAYSMSRVATGLSYPQGVAVDSNGDVYIADSYNNRVLEVTPAPGGGYNAPATIGSSFSNPIGILVDGKGDLYVGDYGNGRIVKEKLSGGVYTPSTLISGLTGPEGVVMDASGNLYIAAYGSNQVLKEDFVDSPSLSFAATLVGSQSSDSPQTTTVVNIGNAPLSLPVPASGDNPSVSANFAWDSASTCIQTTASSSLPFQLAEGASCTLAFDFKPTTFGAISGSSVLTDNNLNQTGAMQAIQLSGTGSGMKAVLTSPAPGSTLTGISATFTWTAVGVTKFEFQLGTTGPGSSNIYNPTGTTTTALSTPLITGLPAYGVTLYARLKSWIGGAWQYNDYTYMESGTPVKAVLTSPAPGATLTGTSVTFNWTAGGGVTKYEFQLGIIGHGSTNVYNASGTTTNSLTTGAITVPANGVTLYARLYSYINGAWQYNDYTYMESGTPVKAVLTSPAPSSTLTGTSVTFNWTAGGGVTKYEFRLGITGHGSGDLYNATGTTTTALSSPLITGIPANGVTLYARLYSYINGAWQYNDYTYTESGTPVKAVLTSPTPGITLTGTSATFTWTAGGGVTKYLFELGTTGHGSSNVYNSAGTSTTALTTGVVSGIPTTGATLYARLYSYINGAWQYNDYTYKEQ